MKLVTLVLCLSIMSACAPKTLSPQGQVVYVADQIVTRLGEVQNAVIAACNAGAGPTCAAGAAVSTETSRALVQAILTATSALKATPQGWQASVLAGWSSAKLTPPLMTAGARGYVLAIDALLGAN
jgi:hypothetical protein